MTLKNPVVVYTAATNIEAHLIVDMLSANGIPAHAVEDQSGVSLWAFGTLSQFHQPNIWVDESERVAAAELIREFEEKQRERATPVEATGEIQVICEACGKTTWFPNSQNGTTQECEHCRAYVDVGELPWEDDYGSAEE